MPNKRLKWIVATSNVWQMLVRKRHSQPNINIGGATNAKNLQRRAMVIEAAVGETAGIGTKSQTISLSTVCISKCGDITANF